MRIPVNKHINAQCISLWKVMVVKSRGLYFHYLDNDPHHSTVYGPAGSFLSLLYGRAAPSPTIQPWQEHDTEQKNTHKKHVKNTDTKLRTDIILRLNPNTRRSILMTTKILLIPSFQWPSVIPLFIFHWHEIFEGQVFGIYELIKGQNGSCYYGRRGGRRRRRKKKEDVVVVVVVMVNEVAWGWQEEVRGKGEGDRSRRL